MKRSLVRQGKDALTVTLPVHWVRDNALRPKDEVDISESGANLVISTKTGKIIKNTEIVLKSINQQYINAVFRNFYINGYDEVNVRFEKEDTLIFIVKALEPLIGYEIVSQKKVECIVKNIAPSGNNEYEQLFRKMFFTVLTMQELIAEALSKGKTGIGKEKLRELSANSSRFSCFCRRTIFQSNIYKNEEGLAKYVCINLVHMIARTCEKAYENISKKSGSKLISFNTEVSELFRMLFDSYCKKDIGLTERVMESREKIASSGLVLLQNKDSAVIAHYLLEIVRLCGTLVGKIGFLNAVNSI